jgi:hypothetical protein
MSRFKLRPSPALLVAFLALFVALGGVGYSAVKLKRNAVKTKNIANGAVTTPKLAADARAPFAGTADSAKQLAGATPDALRSQSAFVADDTDRGLEAGFTNVASTTITTTGTKRLIAQGAVGATSGTAGGDFVQCEINVDGTTGQLLSEHMQNTGSFATVNGAVSPQASAIVGAGEHGVSLLCKGEASSPDGTVTDASLSVIAAEATPAQR